MKLYCLSGHPTLPCNVLKFKSTTIMLDCGLDTTSVLNFLPLPLVHSPRLSKLPGWVSKDGTINLEKELKECAGRVFVDAQPEFCLPERELLDLSTIDVILISNYHCMMALPYITEHTGFTGTVYATEPTLQIGRLLMEELVNFMERVPKAQSATSWKNKEIQRMLPGPLKDAVDVWMWKRCYSMQEVNSALSKVQLVGYSQKVELFGAVQVSPLSSGYSLGSSNWIIQSHHEKVSYVSGSSLLTTHPQPMDQSSLKNSDVLILTGLTQMPTANPDGMLGEFCSNLAMTIRAGGNVLVPCYSSGVIYDLLECLYQFIESANLGTTPFYFISPIANSSLEFSQIFAEWLCHNKQTKVYLPEPPFPHAELIQTNKLKHYPSIHGDFSSEFRQPCVVFTGHPSLRFGDVVHFMELWGKSSLNTIIFTEPDFSYLDALAPYQPLAMKCVYCPIDTRLNFHQVSKLLKEVQPLHVVCPEQYTQPPLTQSHRSDLMLELQPPPMPYRRCSVLNLPFRRRYERIYILPELANSLVPSEIKPGVSVATVSALLHSKDNKHTLQSVPKPPPMPPSKKRKRVIEEPPVALAPKPMLSGAVALEAFLATLQKHGITEVKVEETADGHILHLQAEDTLIQLEEDGTHIVCDSEPLRTTLRDLVLRFLQKL
ncbi:integrator complex subunit 9 [Maylandia zebra]|uniref:Integrator complex subunit 9 n=3 Tax=Haplochromini TaxID=319058 RepID=A0A9Y3QNR7_9CICH|nr:integrator complex subunit 9 [Maylandia zebra]XP_005724886.1 PREDICTED: integrator complex subunit 9 [Pundamilia nyererei]XP_026049778.1 integrator complex subunit 9-like isoform X2 [Astatotilapia calliptera]